MKEEQKALQRELLHAQEEVKRIQVSRRPALSRPARRAGGALPRAAPEQLPQI